MSNSTASNYTYSLMGSGIDGWKNIARGIRQASRGGANYPPYSSSSFIDSSKLGSYYTGAGIIAAFLIISLFFSLFGGVGQCSALLCCKKRVRAKHERMKSKSPPSFRVKICMLVWIVFIYLFFALGAFTSYTGGAVLGNSIVNLGPVGVGLLSSSGSLINSTIPNAKTWFASLALSVSQGVDNSSSYVSSQKLTTDGVIPALNNLATTMSNAGTGAQSLINSGNSISSLNTSASALIATMISDISTIKSTISGWQSSVALPSGGTYTPTSVSLTPDPATLAATAKTNLNAASYVPTFLTNITYTPLACSTCAAAVTNASNSMPSLVEQRVVSQGSAVKDNLAIQLNKTQANLVTSLTSMRDAANSNVNSGISSLNSFSTQATNYNNIRNSIMVTMSTLILVILAVISFFGYRKNPKALKGCNLLSTPIYVVIQIVAVLMFILAVVFGDICSSVFDYSPAPILSGVNGGIKEGINDILLLRDQCSANYSILTVAVNMGLVSADSINTTQLCSGVIDLVDFSPLGSINLASLVVFSPDPATILSPLKNLDLSGLTASSLDTLVNSTLPSLKTSLNSISTALNGSWVTTLTPGASNATATADYITRVSNINTVITSYTTSGGYIDQISTKATAISAGILALPGQWSTINASSYGPATSYYTASQTSMGLYQNHTSADLLAAIPTIKGNIKTQIAAASTILYANLNCTAIGSSLYSFQDAVCGQFLGGLDILWLAYGAIAVSAALSMPVLIWIANRLFYNSNKYVNLAQSPVQAQAPRSNFFHRGAKVVPAADAGGREGSIIKSFPAPISPSAFSRHILPVFTSKKK